MIFVTKVLLLLTVTAVPTVCNSFGPDALRGTHALYNDAIADSIDSQFIYLVIRLVTVIAAFAILVTGAGRICLPAYSVIAGLGVGSLAVALAAQQTSPICSGRLSSCSKSLLPWAI
jgi:hypothetical protein